MEIEYISAQLKESSQRYDRETLSMGPYDTANFLLLCGEILLKYVEYSNKQIEPDSQAFLSVSDIDKIDSLFRELGNNFFPMAHTNAPIRDLKIVNAYEYENISNRVENFLLYATENFERNLEISNEMNERNIRLNRDIIAELRNLKEQIGDVLNP